MIQTHSIEDGRMPGEEMAWRETARNLCARAGLDFETWEVQQSFRGVEGYADATDDTVRKIAQATLTGLGLAEGMLLRVLYRNLRDIQSTSSVTAVVETVKKRGAKLLAVLKNCARGLAEWREKVSRKPGGQKMSAALGRWLVGERAGLLDVLHGIRKETTLFSVQFNDPMTWQRIDEESDGETSLADPAAVIRELLEEDEEGEPAKPKVARKSKAKADRVPDKIKPFRRDGIHFESGCQFVSGLLKVVGRGRISRAHIQDELENLSAKKQTDDVQRKTAAAKALLKLNDHLLRKVISTLRAAARKRIQRNGDYG